MTVLLLTTENFKKKREMKIKSTIHNDNSSRNRKERSSISLRGLGVAIARAAAQIPKVRVKLGFVDLALQQLGRLLQHALEVARCISICCNETDDRTSHESLWWRRGCG